MTPAGYRTILFVGSSGGGGSVSPSISRKSISAARHICEIGMSFGLPSNGLSVLSPTRPSDVTSRNQDTERDDRQIDPDWLRPLLRRSNSLSSRRKPEAKTGEEGVDGRKLPWIGEILDALTSALLHEKVPDGPLHLDELRHDNDLAGEKPFDRFALKTQDLGCLAA